MNSQPKPSNLDNLVFDNRFIRELPADEETINNRRQVFGACYSRVKPTPVVDPQRVAYSREVAELLDLTTDTCEADDFTQVFSGNSLTAGMESYATCYGGHQFGNWAGQLGDGRAINLGEIVNRKGERWALQLKGAGPTPYSRTADGLAVLRSSVREFLCSEAMYHLGVPTTRALSLMLTGENVIRDMFYDGHPKAEPGAVVCRVAPSFTRFGNFQILTARRDIALLKKLVDYTILTDFPHLGEPSPKVYITWFTEVCRRTAEMIIHWQRVGFVHGVMNTDNMSILGLTIDYGPYGWLENYDPNWTPNTTDVEQRRYRFGNQPQIAFWNLGQLANAIYPLIEKVEPFQEALTVYTETFEQGWQTMMAGKLGLNDFNPATDDDLCTELIVLLQLVETDMTLFYRQLAKIAINAEPLSTGFDYDAVVNLLAIAYYVPEQITPEYKTRLTLWLERYINRLKTDGTSNDLRRQRMNAINPKYVLRNYLAQLAIDKAEQGDFSMVNELLELLRHPYDEQPDKDEFAAKRPDWARQRAGCSMLSCSS
ncbi:MAG: hypothetical protein RLZZ419_790 [Pseudomonadota bacterium]|jgi:uncharacterized protein YdiU (UPF0061 family)